MPKTNVYKTVIYEDKKIKSEITCLFVMENETKQKLFVPKQEVQMFPNKYIILNNKKVEC